jgi:hypothetical protein
MIPCFDERRERQAKLDAALPFGIELGLHVVRVVGLERHSQKIEQHAGVQELQCAARHGGPHVPNSSATERARGAGSRSNSPRVIARPTAPAPAIST